MKRGAILGLLAVGLALGLWLVSSDSGETLDEASKTNETSENENVAASQPAPEDAASMSPAAAADLEAPDFRIEEGERLRLDSGSLPQSGDLTISLALSDEARGVEPRTAIVVSTLDGRRLEITTANEAGNESGIRLQIDPTWLAPGPYLVEVRTAEKIALPLRRYVIEVE